MMNAIAVNDNELELVTGGDEDLTMPDVDPIHGMNPFAERKMMEMPTTVPVISEIEDALESVANSVKNAWNSFWNLF